MTTLIRRPEPWSIHPGWGIFVDLTPPQLVNARQLRVWRKLIILTLAAVMGLFLGVYYLAAQHRSSAETTLVDAQTRTTVLQSQAQKYVDVTRIGQASARIRTQIAKQLAGDVAIDDLMDKVRDSLPPDMTIQQASVTISLAGVTSAKPAPGVDVSGHTRIGNIKLSGTGATIDDLSEYVDRLRVIPGVVDVVPTSNTKGDQGVQYTLSLGLDDRLLSHRFDVAKGAK